MGCPPKKHTPKKIEQEGAGLGFGTSYTTYPFLENQQPLCREHKHEGGGDGSDTLGAF